MYPQVRLRRNRRTQWLRDLTAETKLSPENLILPILVIEGQQVRQEVISMPGVYRQSIDQVLATAMQAQQSGIKAIALFPCITTHLKSDDGAAAYDPNNLICRTVRALKEAGITIGIICDIALDPYTTHGHDGIFINGDVDNDQTILALSQQALVLAQAGVDILAPSDMMDGRIMVIRRDLDSAGFIHTNLLAYAAKYNSSFYQPFREAIGSNKQQYLCKASYQMDVRNIKEALKEIEYDIGEGTDMVMIKPALSSLDIIQAAASSFNIRIFAFQVSGEYAMIKIAANAHVLHWEGAMIEALTCIKRAGASVILTYAALEVANILACL